MAANKNLDSLENSPSELHLVQKGKFGQNNQVYQTLDEEYEVVVLYGDGYDFNYQITVNGPRLGISSREYYQEILEETENYEKIEIKFVGGKMVGWFNDSSTGSESNIEPEPEYITQAISAVSDTEIPSRLTAGNNFENMEKANEFTYLITQDMREVYDNFKD